MEVHRAKLEGAASIAFAERGFAEQRTTRPIETLDPHGDADGQVEVMAVYFGPGEKTGVHRHMGGQILVVVEGEAQVVTDDERVVAGAGDVVIAAPGEWHWHGTAGDAPMMHLAIHPQGPGKTERRAQDGA
jgi:quercetin dioxygenase-like cupin family protein